MFKAHEIVWDDEKVARIWDYYSLNKNITDRYFTKQVGNKIVSYLEKNIGLTGKQILDYGSGPGFLLEHIIKSGIKLEYTALDFSEDSVTTLKNKYSNNTIFKNAYFVNKFPTSIEEQFDIIILCEVVEHLDDEKLQSMAVEVYRLLKPGGFVFISTPNNEDLDASKVMCPESGCIFHIWQHMRSWNTENLSKYMSSQNFKIIKVEELLIAKYDNMLHDLKNVAKKILNKSLKTPNLLYIGRKN